MAWNPSANNTFYSRLRTLARAYQDLRNSSQEIEDLWFGEGVSGHADFADVGGITTAEATAMITLSQDFRNFFENGAVSQGDRIPSITPFLTGGP